MLPNPLKPLRRILSREETRRWHSPFSKFLRDSRRDALRTETATRAASEGRPTYQIYDADETLLEEGSAASEKK